MIYTVTLNPSLDYIVWVEKFQTGIVNRTSRELIYPGGKGINVSLVLKNLGHDSTALGFTAGFTGEELGKRLNDMGIHTDFISVKRGLTRINVKIRSQKESEINGQGPFVDFMEVDLLYKMFEKLKDGDILVLGGSVPASMPGSIYMEIIERLSCKNIKIVVDTTRELLVNVLKYNPFLIKPNNHELGEIFGVELLSRDEIIKYAGKLKNMGAQNVIVSMAGDGAVMLTEEDEIYVSDAPKGIVKNSVGAGDSMVAGFLAGYLDSNDYKEAFKLGISAGSASAFCEELGDREAILAILNTHPFHI